MARSFAGVEFNRRNLWRFGLIALACVGIALLYRQIDVAEVHRRAEEINGVLVFLLITVLPLLGFPVSVAHAVAGVRFGLGYGWLVVAFSIVLQLLASYALVKSAPKLFARRLEPLRRRLPHTAHVPLTLFTLLLPGVPYFAKNYVLPLVGVPLRTYLLWSAPIHIARSMVGIAFGDMSDNLTPLRITGFAVYTLALFTACAWAFRRLQTQIQDPPPAADDRTPRA